MNSCFHLAFPVTDLAIARQFYVEGLGCSAGRQSPSSLILNLGGHQIVAHLTREPGPLQQGIYPRHFGLIFAQETEWEALCQRAIQGNLTFYQPPRERFRGTDLEHRTFFLSDPFQNLLEFKYYRNPETIFGATEHALVGDAIMHRNS
jgi:uncharacterized protein